MTGEIDAALGWIRDFADIERAWQRHVHAKLDHTLLNETIANPTTEMIVQWVYAALHPSLSSIGLRILRIEVDEGSRNRCVLRVEQPEAAE